MTKRLPVPESGQQVYGHLLNDHAVPLGFKSIDLHSHHENLHATYDGTGTIEHDHGEPVEGDLSLCCVAHRTPVAVCKAAGRDCQGIPAPSPREGARDALRDFAAYVRGIDTQGDVTARTWLNVVAAEAERRAEAHV